VLSDIWLLQFRFILGTEKSFQNLMTEDIGSDTTR
jgi:hypothetical protein